VVSICTAYFNIRRICCAHRNQLMFITDTRYLSNKLRLHKVKGFSFICWKSSGMSRCPSGESNNMVSLKPSVKYHRLCSACFNVSLWSSCRLSFLQCTETRPLVANIDRFTFRGVEPEHTSVCGRYVQTVCPWLDKRVIQYVDWSSGGGWRGSKLVMRWPARCQEDGKRDKTWKKSKTKIRNHSNFIIN
jgi:hypothetical protein